MILNDNSTQQINTLVIQLQNRITNLTNESRKLNNNIDNLDSEISDLEKRVSSNENDADNNIGDLDSKISDLEKRVSSLANDTAAMNNEISDLEKRVSSLANDAAAMNTAILANTEAISGKADKSHTHTKSDITDFPTSLPANGGTADSANVPTGFEKIGNQDIWGNQDGVFITDWQTPAKEYGNGDISFRHNKGQLNVIIDGVFYQNEGKYKLVDENSLKDIMKPNYTTGRLPAGVYKGGQAVSVSVSITTTRGNPVFISYSGDFNSVNPGSTVPWIAFELFVDGQIVQRTSVDNSVALESDNTPFAGNALAVLSAGSHIIRLAASLLGDASGQIQFQEQENIVNLVAFEL